MNSPDEQRILKLIRLARGVEAGGYYNLSKLLWAMAYAQEIQTSNNAGVPRGAMLIGELETMIEVLREQDAPADLIQALECGTDAVREDRTNLYEEIPHAYVSRLNGEIFLGKPSARTDGGDDPLDLREFLPIYYFDAMRPVEIIEALRSYPGTITPMIEGLSEEQLNQAPVEGAWSVRELFWHFAMAQKVFEGRVEQMLAEDNVTLKSVAVWSIKSEGLSTEQILDLYRESRQKTLDLLESVAPGDWWRAAWHDEFGRVTLLQQASYFARHERSHLAQLVSTIKAVSA
ncbi:DinB family protein [Aggregatilinea lenta]|uniref:DinB family protein n=1 Tax=Aggregatilinea lenta TaxID=913108 RepID=UPI000E5BEF30|nr:DinB family protein [Aggregatilinea lenta]